MATMNGTKHVHVAPEKMRQGVDQRNNAEAPPVILRVWLKDMLKVVLVTAFPIFPWVFRITIPKMSGMLPSRQVLLLRPAEGGWVDQMLRAADKVEHH